MAAAVRALTTLGMDRFRAQLERLRKGTHSERPSELLEGGGYTTELPVEITIEPREFGSRLELASYLVDRLGSLDANTVEPIPGLWGWLSLYYFDQVCPIGRDGCGGRARTTGTCRSRATGIGCGTCSTARTSCTAGTATWRGCC
ncbi:MAG: hypothetical protein U5K76_16035 [Woeseiaceae bacterium]|nr:hypothetical protein [Woeseiaceae bacterium]